MERKHVIGLAVAQIFKEFNVDGHYPEIMKQICRECLWMEHHQLKLSVYYDRHNQGKLSVSHDGHITFNGCSIESLPAINFVWLPDVIAYADCPSIKDPHDGDRFINYCHNQMKPLSICQWKGDRWISTTPSEGQMVYLSGDNLCVYFDGDVWNMAFNATQDQMITLKNNV